MCHSQSHNKRSVAMATVTITAAICVNEPQQQLVNYLC